MECRNSRQFVRSRYRHICCAEREDSGAILCCQDHAEALNSQPSAPCACLTRERDGAAPPKHILGPKHHGKEEHQTGQEHSKQAMEHSAKAHQQSLEADKQSAYFATKHGKKK